MIIDCHCHAGSGDGLTAPWDTAASLDKYVARAGRAGIDRTVLFAAFHSDYAIANYEVSRIVNARPDRFIGFCFVNSVRDRGRVAELVRTAVERYGFVGIKAHRFNCDITREVCDVARALGLPILYDVMGKVSVVEMLATAYPDVPFIFPTPRQLRRQLARQSRDDRSSRAAHQRPHRQLRRATLRFSRTNHRAGGRAQAALRIGRSVDSSRCRASKDSRVTSLAER